MTANANAISRMIRLRKRERIMMSSGRNAGPRAHLSPTRLPGTPSVIGTAVSLYQGRRDTAACQHPRRGPGTVLVLFRRNLVLDRQPLRESAFRFRVTGARLPALLLSRL